MSEEAVWSHISTHLEAGESVMATHQASYIQQVCLGLNSSEVRLYQGRMCKLFIVYTVHSIVSCSPERGQLAPWNGLLLWDWWVWSFEWKG